MVTTSYPDQQGSKSRQKVMRLYKRWHRAITKRYIKPPLLHIESSLDRLGLLLPTHDQRSQQQIGQIKMAVVRDQLFAQKPTVPVRAFDSRAQGFSPPLARQRSSCPPLSPNLVRTHPIENYQALRDSAPCLSRAATLPKGTKLELGRGAHLKTPSSANHTAAASQPTGRIAKAVSWLHLSRVSPALHPPERPSHTHTPKPGFGGRGHEIWAVGGVGRWVGWWWR